ncbi:MAG: hypothetical protein WBZ01_15260, partial [Terriglobales bacterium]
ASPKRKSPGRNSGTFFVTSLIGEAIIAFLTTFYLPCTRNMDSGLKDQVKGLRVRIAMSIHR